jgi:thiosulfate dehydrogenase [quinone] large subunit
VIATAELAVGLLTLAGLASKGAAGVGLSLSLSFFLTASWHTRPFFYGPDLPFAVGWLVLLLAGHAGLPSVDRWLAERERAAAGLPPQERLLAVPADRLETLCADGDPRGRCAAAAGRACRGAHCPLMPPASDPAALEASRRSFLQRAVATGMTVTGVGLLGGLAALVAPLVGARDRGASPPPRALPRALPKPAPSGPSRSTAAGSQPPGIRIGSLSQMPVGQAASFTNPHGGRPAILVRLSATRAVAFDAVCTHAGCTVGFDAATMVLACPCHGAEFDPAHGAAVIGGPAPSPLSPIALHIGPGGRLYVTGSP